MKKFKSFLALTLVGLMALSSIPTEIFAQTNAKYAYRFEPPVSKTATLNNLQVSFNGGEVTNIQGYLVEGEQFVPIRAITQPLNMGIQLYISETSRTIELYTDFYLNVEYPVIYKKSYAELTKKVALPTFNEQSLTADIIKYQISYDQREYYGDDGDTITSYETFNYNGFLFIKLDDIKKVSGITYNKTYDDIARSAAYAKKFNDFDGAYDAMGTDKININHNPTTDITNINMERIDFSPTFYELSGFTPPPKVEQPKPTPPPVDTITKSLTAKNQVHKVAPTVGNIYANIIIDSAKPLYKNNDSSNSSNAIDENFTENYQDWDGYDNVLTPVGQCIWYARGRFTEVTGIKVPDAYNYFFAQDKSEMSKDITKITDPYKIQAPALGVWNGHVLFIEYVEYDSNGKPINVYFSESNLANYLPGQPYRPSIDGAIQKISIEEFITRGNHVGQYLEGYLIPTDHAK